MAKAGMIIGYINLGLTILAILVAAVMLIFFFAAHRATTRTMFPISPPITQNEPSAEAQPGSDQTTNSAPDTSGWTLDLTDVSIPEQPVSGRVHGNDFSVEKVTLEGGWLKFKKGAGFFADQEVDVVTFQQELAGKTFDVDAKEKSGMHPHIYLHWQDQNNAPAQKSYTGDYAMHLEFGQPENGKLTGKIYLCLPDPDKSFVRGTFEIPSSK